MCVCDPRTRLQTSDALVPFPLFFPLRFLPDPMTQKSIPSIISHRLLFFPPRVQKRWVKKKEGEENVGKGWRKRRPFQFSWKTWTSRSPVNFSRLTLSPMPIRLRSNNRFQKGVRTTTLFSPTEKLIIKRKKYLLLSMYTAYYRGRDRATAYR